MQLPVIFIIGYSLLLAPCITLGQADIHGKVYVVNNKVVPGISILLLHSGDSAQIQATQTDASGMYSFKEVIPGRYFTLATTIGHRKTYSASFTVKSNDVNIHLPDIWLPVESSVLQQVTVTAPVKQIESKNGKLIYNIDKSITAQGTTAFDQVRRTPGITVDAEDNLALRGSSAVTIMIDGKMTYLGTQQLSTYLKSLPAENLARIEVMATPSSQYDAAGNAGIINIVTKKLNRQGYALNLRTAIGGGKYLQSTDGLIGNIRTKAINFFGSYSYNYNHTNLVRTSYRTISTGGKVTSYDRHSIDPAVANNNSYKAGVDLYLSRKTTAGFVYNGTHNRWERNAAGPTYLRNVLGGIDSIAHNKNITIEPAASNTWNVNFITRFDTSGGQLSTDADYALYHNNSTGSLSNGLYTVGGVPLQPYQSLSFRQPGDITIHSVKTDLVLPAKGSTWKAGAKYAYVTTDNNFRYDSLLNGNSVYSKVLSNHFIYDEKVVAGYLSFTTQLNKTISADAGTRIEHTLSKGELVNINNITERKYTNLFPYLSVTKSLPGENSFSLSFTRRINRPVYANLNPSRYFFDKYSFSEGNPFLQPELSWNEALSYTFKQNYIATLTYARTTNAIQDFAQQDSTTGTLKVSSRNFSHKDAADFLLVLPFKPFSFWSVQTTLDLIYVHYLYHNGNEFFDARKLNADVQLSQTFSLPKGMAAELATFYTSPSLNGVYILRPYFQTDAGIKKFFLNNKLDAALSCKDLFRTNRYWAYSIYGPTNIRYDHRPDSRRINLSLMYHIGGKLSAGKDKRTEEQNRL